MKVETSDFLFLRTDKLSISSEALIAYGPGYEIWIEKHPERICLSPEPGETGIFLHIMRDTDQAVSECDASVILRGPKIPILYDKNNQIEISAQDFFGSVGLLPNTRIILTPVHEPQPKKD